MIAEELIIDDLIVADLKKAEDEYLKLLSDNPKIAFEHNTRNQTLLHAAARDGAIHVTVKLLTLKADLNAKDENGNTPLHIACQHKHSKIAFLLRSVGAHTELRNTDGFTARDLETEKPLAKAAEFQSRISIIEDHFQEAYFDADTVADAVAEVETDDSENEASIAAIEKLKMEKAKTEKPKIEKEKEKINSEKIDAQKMSASMTWGSFGGQLSSVFSGLPDAVSNLSNSTISVSKSFLKTFR